MRKYVTPKAEKLTFNYSNNVNASATFPTTDVSTQWWECHTRYEFGDSPVICGSQNEMSTAYWVCNNN